VADEWLIFVDTNIFLDFYRASGESAKRQLNALERHQNRLITGDQVRMEFLNNRQRVILKSLNELKRPAKDGLPQIFSGTQAARMMAKHQDNAIKKFKEIRTKAEKMLADPTHHDQVFQTFNRIFDANTPLNLCRPKKERFAVRSLARKRFALGYPPRKAGDNSIGDALNWEWIVRCAESSEPNQHILIVSRDGDFGAVHNGTAYLNDWLYREFKDRVSKKRKIELTARLTDALKRLDETVAAEDEREEEKIIREWDLEISAEELEEIERSLDLGNLAEDCSA